MPTVVSLGLEQFVLPAADFIDRFSQMFRHMEPVESDLFLRIWQMLVERDEARVPHFQGHGLDARPLLVGDRRREAV